jgi:hypothetical protein
MTPRRAGLLLPARRVLRLDRLVGLVDCVEHRLHVRDAEAVHAVVCEGGLQVHPYVGQVAGGRLLLRLLRRRPHVQPGPDGHLAVELHTDAELAGHLGRLRDGGAGPHQASQEIAHPAQVVLIAPGKLQDRPDAVEVGLGFLHALVAGTAERAPVAVLIRRQLLPHRCSTVVALGQMGAHAAEESAVSAATLAALRDAATAAGGWHQSSLPGSATPSLRS